MPPLNDESIPAGAHAAPAPRYGASWGSNFVDLTVPSGGLVQVSRPGLQGLIGAGVLESLDSLTGIVQTETIPKAAGNRQIDAATILKDPKKVDDMLATIDRVVLHVVKQPTVLKTTVTEQADETHPNGPWERPMRDDERDPEAHYIDGVPMDDKMFILQFVLGGSPDLAEFRAKTAEVVGSISGLETTQQIPQ